MRNTTWYIVLAVALALRTIALGRWPGINGDEAWYGVNVQEFLNGGAAFWHTGVGNPLNPIHSGLLLVLSLVFEPSGALLRVPEVILGMAAVAAAYPLLAAPFGRRVAMLVTAFLAVAPATVAYSRLGWDPSGTPLMTLLALGGAMANRPLLALAASALAYFIHPTNVFIVPIVAAAWAPHASARYHASDEGTRVRVKRLAIAAIVIAIPAAVWMAVGVANNPNTTLPSVSMVIDRVTSPGRWIERLWGFVNLAGGVSTAAHIAAPVAPAVSLAVNAFTALCLVVGLGESWRSVHGRWLIGGMAAGFAGFHVVAMDLALQPTLERYGMFMLVPLFVVAATAVDGITRVSAIAGRTAAAVTISVCAAMTVGAYFYPLASRGGDAMITYRTGDREPKLAAFEFIASSSGSAPVRVIAEDWFLYWTLRYFATPSGRIQVEPATGASLPGGVRPAGAAAPPVPAPQHTYLVAFAGSGYAAALKPSLPVFTAVDPIGRPVVEVHAVAGSTP